MRSVQRGPLYESESRPLFSGHETFPLRYGWLKKAFDAVAAVEADEKNKSVFLGDDAIARVRELAAGVFTAIGNTGLARCDFFLTDDGEVLVNEINTIPGFTRISMFPKLMEASGLPAAELMSRLIDDALTRAARKRRLRTTA